MKLHVANSKINGIFSPPPSKSHTLRAIILAAFAKGESRIYNYLESPDTNCLIDSLQKIGAKITKEKEFLLIQGNSGSPPCCNETLFVGNSGIVFRFLMGILSTSNNQYKIDGDQSIRENRPIHPLLDSLKQLGVEVSEATKFPIVFKGPFLKHSTEVCGEDSQFVSSLIFSALFCKNPVEISVKNPGEHGWIELTLFWLRFLGVKYEYKNYIWYKIFPPKNITGFNYVVPPDISSTVFPVVAALITDGKAIINNVDLSIPCGDNSFYNLVEKIGAKIEVKNSSLVVSRSKKLQGAELDINSCIDSITSFAVLGCFLPAPLTLNNIAVAATKECNRITSIAKELRKMGAKIDYDDNTMKIFPSSLRGATLDSYNDHRMLYSLAIASLGAIGKSTITNAQCMKKTYQQFVEHFINAGANIEVEL